MDLFSLVANAIMGSLVVEHEMDRVVAIGGIMNRESSDLRP